MKSSPTPNVGLCAGGPPKKGDQYQCVVWSLDDGLVELEMQKKVEGPKEILDLG